MKVTVSKNVGLLQQLREGLGQAGNDANLMQGHINKANKARAGLVGDKAVIAGRGNSVGAMFPVAPSKKKKRQ